MPRSHQILGLASGLMTFASCHGAATAPIARQHPPLCRGSALQSQLRAGAEGTGREFGTILIRNVGPHDCRLAGQVGFAAYYQSGARDPNTTVQHDPGWFPSFRHDHIGVTLPARTPRAPRRGEPAGYVPVILEGAERDDPARANGLCRQDDERAPASLVVSVGGVRILTPNHDRVDGTTVFGCHGDINLGAVLRH